MINQSITTLHYRLRYGPVDLEPLRVLDARATDWHGCRIAFFILGASHAVRLERGRLQLTEMLTCTTQEEAGRLANAVTTCSLPLAEDANDRDVLAAPVGGECMLNHQGSLWTCRVRLLPFPLQDHPEDDLQGCFAPSDRMAFAFPSAHGPRAPITRIGWRAEGDRLTVETLHTYPEEGQGVRSFSVFTLQDAVPSTINPSHYQSKFKIQNPLFDDSSPEGTP